MIAQSITWKGTLSAVVIAWGVAAFATQTAMAQAAGNVVCNGCVNSSDIEKGGVRSRNIRNKAVNAQKLKNRAVTNSKLANNAVTGGKIADGAVGSADLAANAVTRDKIADGAVNGDKVENGSLTAADLSDGVGVGFEGGSQELLLDLNVDTEVRSVTITAPEDGFVILNASGRFFFAAANAEVWCSLTTGDEVELFDSQQAGGINTIHNQFFGMTEGFIVSAGSTTFNLVCEELTDGVIIVDSDLTAIYAPTRY